MVGPIWDPVHKYATTGILRLKHDAGRSVNWRSLSWNSKQPSGTSIKFRTRTSDSSVGLANATWSDYISSSGSGVSSPAARWIEVEATLATINANVTPLLNDVTVNSEGNQSNRRKNEKTIFRKKVAAREILYRSLGTCTGMIQRTRRAVNSDAGIAPNRVNMQVRRKVD